jgi:hypothetical protein
VNERGHVLGVTPLMLAVALGHTAVVRLLLDGSSHFYTHVNVRANASVLLAALGAVSPGDGVAAAAAAGVAVDSGTMMRSRGDGVAAGVDVGGGGGAGAAGGVGAVVASACADSGSVMLTARDVAARLGRRAMVQLLDTAVQQRRRWLWRKAYVRTMLRLLTNKAAADYLRGERELRDLATLFVSWHAGGGGGSAVSGGASVVCRWCGFCGRCCWSVWCCCRCWY